MQNDIDDLIKAVDKIADTSFNATDTFGANNIAKRPSGGSAKGFYRPGERDQNGAPFKVSPTKCPKYPGPPSGRAPTNEEKRGAWQLQDEYLAGRLGKNGEENSRLWNTAKWIDRLCRIATMPAEAVKTLNLSAGDWVEVAHPEEISEGFGVGRIKIDERDKERLALKLSDYDLACLVDDIKDCDELAKTDINKLVRNADPLPERIDLPGPIERQEAIKIVRMLMVGMRSLWHPVKRSITDHATMKSLGKTQNVGDGVAAAVGRARVIEGLRLAESIRKGLTRQERAPFSMWLNQIRAKQIPMQKPGLTAARRQASVDAIIKEVLAILPDKSLPKPVRAPAGHYWNLAAGPVIKLADNDNCRVEAVASNAA
jgi:hypothetical protein